MMKGALRELLELIGEDPFLALAALTGAGIAASLIMWVIGVLIFALSTL